MTFAGLPATATIGGTFLKTTEPAATTLPTAPDAHPGENNASGSNPDAILNNNSARVAPCVESILYIGKRGTVSRVVENLRIRGN